MGAKKMGLKKTRKAASRVKSTGSKQKQKIIDNIPQDDEWWNNPGKYIRDGRIFEADREMVFSEDEEDEMKEFKETLKHYHATCRKLRRTAITQEQEELKNGKVLGYFEGTIKDRLEALRAGQRLLENSEMLASHRVIEN